MKLNFCVIAAGLLPLFTAQAQQTIVTIDPRPTVACIEFVKKDINASRFSAASVCKDGVTIECMEKVIATDSTITRLEAAASCQGSPSAECVSYLTKFAVQPLKDVMKVCAGKYIE